MATPCLIAALAALAAFTSLVDECEDPIEWDAIVSISWPLNTVGGRRLEVHADGRTRSTLGGVQEKEMWLEPSLVRDVIDSLHGLTFAREHREPASPPTIPAALIVELTCLDSAASRPLIVAVPQASNLWSELRAMSFWLLRQLSVSFWVNGPHELRICEPDVRRSLHLDVVAPVWCAGRYAQEPRWSDPESLERLRRLSRRLPPARP